MKAALLWLLALFMLMAATPASAQPVLKTTDPARVMLNADRCESLAGGRFQKLDGAATWVTNTSLR